jgi:hypothetical protein
MPHGARWCRPGGSRAGVPGGPSLELLGIGRRSSPQALVQRGELARIGEPVIVGNPRGRRRGRRSSTPCLDQCAATCGSPVEGGRPRRFQHRCRRSEHARTSMQPAPPPGGPSGQGKVSRPRHPLDSYSNTNAARGKDRLDARPQAIRKSRAGRDGWGRGGRPVRGARRPALGGHALGGVTLRRPVAGRGRAAGRGDLGRRRPGHAASSFSSTAWARSSTATGRPASRATCRP